MGVRRADRPGRRLADVRLQADRREAGREVQGPVRRSRPHRHGDRQDVQVLVQCRCAGHGGHHHLRGRDSRATRPSRASSISRAPATGTFTGKKRSERADRIAAAVPGARARAVRHRGRLGRRPRASRRNRPAVTRPPTARASTRNVVRVPRRRRTRRARAVPRGARARRTVAQIVAALEPGRRHGGQRRRHCRRPRSRPSRRSCPATAAATRRR